MTSLPPNDPRLLATLPCYEVPAEWVLHRGHNAGNSLVYFSHDGYGRFDPPTHERDNYGTCYFAGSDEGAFLEKLGRLGPYLNEERIRGVVMGEASPSRNLCLADLTNRLVIGAPFYIDNDIASGREYLLAQAYGAALRAAGWDGVTYWARHDPTQQERSFAIFGPPGAQPFEEGASGVSAGQFDRITSQPIANDLLDRMERKHGIVVVPTTELP